MQIFTADIFSCICNVVRTIDLRVCACRLADLQTCTEWSHRSTSSGEFESQEVIEILM